MRYIRRSALGPRESQWLQGRTVTIQGASPAGRKTLAAAQWKSDKQNQSRNPLGRILEELKAMASGLERCMYCEDNAGTDVDHFWPKTSYPEKTFCWDNLLLACSCCNSGKLAEFPLTAAKTPILLDPTLDDPQQYLILIASTGQFEPRAAEDGSDRTRAVETLRIFRLNSRRTLVRGRVNAWLATQIFLERYDQAVAQGDATLREQCKVLLCQQPFSTVFAMLCQLEASDPGLVFMSEASRNALQQHPEIRTWL